MHAALFQAEAQHNVAELSGLVRSIGVESSNEDTVIYAVETLEREPIRVEFVRDIGYVVGPRVFESMQALLSEASPEYRSAQKNVHARTCRGDAKVS